MKLFAAPAYHAAVARSVLIVALLCAPVAYLAWHGRDMPQLGFLADDAIYLVSAKSLAAGEGYRILSLPGAPSQTKYPPLYPLLLSLVWKINPEFPGNLRIAALLAWLMLPLLIGVARLYFGRLGLSSTHCWILCALLAVNARVAMFSLNLMPELPLVSALLVCTMLADSDTGGRGGEARLVSFGRLAAVEKCSRSSGWRLSELAPYNSGPRKGRSVYTEPGEPIMEIRAYKLLPKREAFVR